MSVAPLPSPQTARPRVRGDLRFDAPAPWAGIAIAAMWMAVLFVGLFGGTIVSSSSNGGASVPAAVALAVFAAIATVPVARWGFTDRSVRDELRGALAEERAAREALATEVAALRGGLDHPDQG